MSINMLKNVVCICSLLVEKNKETTNVSHKKTYFAKNKSYISNAYYIMHFSLSNSIGGSTEET